MTNNAFDKAKAEAAIAEGRADLIAFGRPFIANPDLVVRLLLDAPLAQLDRETLYGGGERGYTDYPAIRGVSPDICFKDRERSWG
jgi:N-ethylmaleimide reductase